MNTSDCRRLALAAGLALTTCSCALHQTGKDTPPPDPAVVAANPGVRRLAAGTNAFGFQLLHQLTIKQSGNVFFSPFSISQALLLTLNGAGGQTQTDIARTLGLTDLPQDQINAANALLLPSVTNPDPKVKVSVANALWANYGIVFAPAYQERCRRFYNAEAATLDFGSPAAADTINGWVSRNTEGKITQIVSPEGLSASEAVLTSAVYFHGTWQSPFDKSETVNGPFFLADRHTKTVPLMSQTKTFPYRDTPKFQAVSLPYGAGRMSMVVFLPKPGTSLSAVVSGLNTGSMNRIIGAMKPTELSIVLPRFQASYEANLNAPLSALGMGSAFSPGADFGPMGLHGAHISSVLHKAVLEVDEEGTIAAAATGVMMQSKYFVPGTIVRVDHPFFCAIRDKVTGNILFESVIQNPQG